MTNEIKKLEEAIEERAKKSEDVLGKIERQDRHMKAIAKRRDAFSEHLVRWARQNHRDQKTIERLKNETVEATEKVDNE